MNEKLISTAKAFGDRAIFCPVSILNTIENDIEKLKESEHFGHAAQAAVRDFYNLNLPETDFTVRSLVISAKFEPVVKLKFCFRGKEFSVYTPNTYRNARKHDEQPSCYLKKLFDENGFFIQEWGTHFNVPPMKKLAVRSGFAKYGRNNITYVEGLGSRFTLSVFVSDYECDEIEIQELQHMERCTLCNNCIKACPTQAIMAERKKITPERCLTYLNEFIDLCDFPDWLDKTAHHSTHGCIRCQIECPANSGAIHLITPVSFSESETEMLINGTNAENLPEETRKKLEEVDELEYLPLFQRNLSAVFQI
jgi:epoxyqueuosine reductase